MLHNLGSELKDHLQHVFMVVPLDIHGAEKSSTFFTV